MRRDAEEALLQARDQQAQVEDRLASVETSKVELLEEARQELLERISGLLARLQQVERSWDRPDAAVSRKEDQTYLTEARRQIISPQWEPIKVRRATWQESLKSGDRVFIRGIGHPVEVITPPDEQGQVEVLLGTMRSKIPVYQLERPRRRPSCGGPAGRLLSPVSPSPGFHRNRFTGFQSRSSDRPR